MSEQNQNPTDEPLVFTQSEVNAIVQQRLTQDRARRGNPPPAGAASATSATSATPAAAAPAPSGTGMEQRFERLESMFGSLIERLSGAPQSATTIAPPSSPPPAPPAAAPAPPQSHTLPTAQGFPDIWNMTPEQFVQFRNSGQLKSAFEKMLDAGARMQGAPRRPMVPFTIAPSGERVLSPSFSPGTRRG